MESVLIEYYRFDDGDTGLLTKGKRYILAHQKFPVLQVATVQNQVDLLRQMAVHFRYDANVSAEDKWKTIVAISDTIKAIFIDLAAFQYNKIQLDVVFNPSELCLLPFELLLDENNKPFFANEVRPLTLTRRFRQDDFEKVFPWPDKPRMLFVYAHGGGRQVPYQNHMYWLQKSLEKWGPQDPEVFQVLAEPGFDKLAETIRSYNNSDKPFTHIHILAHGAKMPDALEFEYEYGIAFGTADAPPTGATLVKDLFSSLKRKPFLVNYMICDGANFANPMTADKNPVQVTHKAGVPIVLGSQFPLTMDGSVLITELLYTKLLDGHDIRELLHIIKTKLYQKGDGSHDWVSLAAYVRLPEGFDDYQLKSKLQLQMQQLKFIKTKTDAYATTKFTNDDFLDRLTELNNCVSNLEANLQSISANFKYEGVVLENLGLIASCYKRIAELSFLKTTLPNCGQETEIGNQLAFLGKAMEYYKKACDKNLSHHWTLVQYLALDVVLNGQITNMGYWYAAELSVKNELSSNPESGWAVGSLIELLLLKNKVADPSENENVFSFCNKLKSISVKQNNPWLITSTVSQISKYLDWWTVSNRFKERTNALVSDTVLVKKVIGKLQQKMDTD